RHPQLGHRRPARGPPQLRVERQITHQKNFVQIGLRLDPPLEPLPTAYVPSLSTLAPRTVPSKPSVRGIPSRRSPPVWANSRRLFPAGSVSHSRQIDKS